MTRVAILGAAGYTGLELIKILLRHPEVEITALADRLEGQPHVASIHPSLIGRLDLRLETLTPAGAGGPGGVHLLLLAARSQCLGGSPTARWRSQGGGP